MEFDPARSVYLNDEITAHSSMEIIMGISKIYTNNPVLPITLFINSTGGNIIDAFAIYEYVMRMLKPNFQTVVLGEASSMAVLLLLMGDKRLMAQTAFMRFHKFSYTPREVFPITSSLARKIRQGLGESEKKYTEIVAERSGGRTSQKQALILMRNEVLVSATKAVELGLAHEIL